MLPEKREKLVFSIFIIFVFCVMSYVVKKTYDEVCEMNSYLKDNIHYQNEYIRGMILPKKQPVNPLNNPKRDFKKQALHKPCFLFINFFIESIRKLCYHFEDESYLIAGHSRRWPEK